MKQMHCLLYYIPVINDETWMNHNLGIGIFNIKGFKHKNKESKNTMKRFCNKKGNIVIQNIKRLFYLFYHSKRSF